jgi:hypothetical protein
MRKEIRTMSNEKELAIELLNKLSDYDTLVHIIYTILKDYFKSEED